MRFFRVTPHQRQQTGRPGPQTRDQAVAPVVLHVAHLRRPGHGDHDLLHGVGRAQPSLQRPARLELAKPAHVLALYAGSGKFRAAVVAVKSDRSRVSNRVIDPRRPQRYYGGCSILYL